MSADAIVKSFIDRILRLKEEQDELTVDIREVYAEAKGNGYDKTAMGEVVAYLRKIEKKGKDAVSERTAIFDLYLAAYERPSHTHAREGQSYADAKGRGFVAGLTAEQKAAALAYDGDDTHGEITEHEQPETAQNEPEAAAEVAGDYLREPDAADQGQIIREGDAPRETDRESGDASYPNAEFQVGENVQVTTAARNDAGKQGVTAGETAQNSPSDGGAFSEVKGTARPENAAGVEPSSSDNQSAPASPRLNYSLPARGSDESAGLISPSAVAPAEPEAEPRSIPLASGTNRSMSISPLEPREAGGLKGFGFTVSFTDPQADSSPEADKPEAVSPPSTPAVSGALSDDDVPAFLKKDQPRKTAKDYRPHCQRPEACGSSGLHHCYTCQKAIGAAAESEAA